MKNLSLQNKLIGCILLTSTALLVLSLYLLNRAWEENRKADKILALSGGANYFIMTLKDLTFERGRTNVVLSSQRPVSVSDRSFINERRRLVDHNMDHGLNWLERVDLQLSGQLKRRYQDFIRRRGKADEVMNKNRPAEPGVYPTTDEWFRESTELIHKIIDTVDIVAKRQNLPGNFENYYRYMIRTLEFRDRIGQSGSIITASITKGRRMTQYEYRAFMANLAQADYLWSNIEVIAAAINSPELNRQKSIVHQKYYESYRPLLEKTIQQADNGSVPPGRAKQLQELSVPAFDSVFSLMDRIKYAISSDLKKQKQRAMLSLALASFQFIAGVLIILFTIIYFRNKLFKPLNNLTAALESIRTGEPVPDLAAEITRNDEIGQLAEGVKMLQLSMYEERNLRKLTEMMAITDELTGLYNRHFLEKSIEGIITRSDRYDEPAALILFDLDHFKNVNDTWGHPAGDDVLKKTAMTAKNIIRSSDMLVRIGGEEFIVLMPNTSTAGGAAVAEKMREAIGKIDHPEIGTVTASFGVAERKKGESFESWYSRTDGNLYYAKQSGRNMVKI